MSAIESAREWYRFAKMDSDTARHIFNTMNPKPLEISCYLSQQSAEKLLKGFLTENDKDPPKTHDLLYLCDMCIKIDDIFEPLRVYLGKLNPYGVQPRYPQEMDIIEDDVIQALKYLDSITAFFEKNIFEKNTAI